MSLLVSVIVPVLADSEQLGALLPTLPERDDVEILVVSGAPYDQGMDRLRARFPSVIFSESRPGRAEQMNAGARQATGRWLLFLHADTRLSPAWFEEVQRVDPDERVVGGSFRFTLRSPARAARAIEWGVERRVRWFGLPYGDQALFVRCAVFEAMGGYRSIPLMEDVGLVRLLKRQGRLEHSRVPVSVSARRWERDGWIRRTLENTLLVFAYLAGVSPFRLARIYYRERFPPAAAPARIGHLHEPQLRPPRR